MTTTQRKHAMIRQIERLQWAVASHDSNWPLYDALSRIEARWLHILQTKETK